MAIRKYKPTSPGRRNASVNLHVEVTKSKPEKSLVKPLVKTGGRNNQGKITVRGRGGGAKRLYRMIDFKRKDRNDIPAKVIAIEYDPNRSCHIALLEYQDGVKRYIPAPKGLKVGTTIECSRSRPVEPEVGNMMPLRYIPTGFNIHCIELSPGKGGQICRSAGVSARLSNKEGRYATIILPSGETRKVLLDCIATIGEVGNSDHQHRRLGKAGLSRHLGRRPISRGMAMSHHAHPLGGGEGRSKGGRPPCGPSGTLAKGGRTRNRNKPSSKLIIRRRTSKRYGLVK